MNYNIEKISDFEIRYSVNEPNFSDGNSSLDFCVPNSIVKNPSRFDDYESCFDCTQSAIVEIFDSSIDFEGSWCQATITSELIITDEVIKFFDKEIVLIAPWDV